MHFHQSSFYSCLFITVTNIVTQGNEDLSINYMMFFCDDLCYIFDEFMADMMVRCTHWHHELFSSASTHLNLVITRRVIQHVVTHIDKNHSITAFMMLTVWLPT